MAAGNSRRPQQRGGLVDSAPRSTVIEEFDVPDMDGLWEERTQDFGSIRTIGLRLLTPLNEKAAAAAAKGDPLTLAFELARRSLAFVISDTGPGGKEDPKLEKFLLQEADGSSVALWAQVHPRIRTLAMQANAEISVPNEVTSAAFLLSRRTTV